MPWRPRYPVALLFVVVIGAAAVEPSSRGPIAVVVSNAWETPDEITIAMLRRVYLGRTTEWAERRIERYDLAPGSAARRAFAIAVLGRSERELEDYWLEQALTGGALPPREVDGVAEMLRVIASQPGAIGYLPISALSPESAGSLRVLAIRTPDAGAHLPDEPTYPIQLVPMGD